ncbi:MAG: F0F1 ATP synthase subunit A [Chloroflexota bacterium]
MSEATTTRRFGVKRWLVLGLIALGIYAAFLGPSILKPISPVVVLPAEPVYEGAFVTNTIVATIIADLLVLLMAFGAYRFHKSGKTVPSGFYNFFEFLLEFLWTSVEGTTGKWAKRVFPVVATIFLLVFAANVSKLVPGYESFGWLKEAHKAPAYAVVPLFKLGGTTVYTLDKGQPVEVAKHSAEGESHGEAAPAEGEAHAAEGAAPCHACEVVPYLRGMATDLNFPLALAVIAVVMTQVYGIWALGPSYLEKFFQVKALVGGGIFGLINFAVGILELLLEFAKILSFSFRLFGNIFAGTLLLSIVGALTAVAVPPFLYLFEVFFGIIQAYVFFLLATMFISMGLVSHHADEHGEQHVETAK